MSQLPNNWPYNSQGGSYQQQQGQQQAQGQQFSWDPRYTPHNSDTTLHHMQAHGSPYGAQQLPAPAQYPPAPLPGAPYPPSHLPPRPLGPLPGDFNPSPIVPPSVPQMQRHSYPLTSQQQASSSSSQSQFAVITPTGRTLAAAENYKEAIHAARSAQRVDSGLPADDSRVCPYCGKVCDRPSTLRTHLNSHTGARPHTCTVPGCGRQFTVLSNMYRHAKTCAAQRNRETQVTGDPVLLSLPPPQGPPQ